MAKSPFLRLHGAQSFRQRLLLATLSATPVVIDSIRADSSTPGLRPEEISLLRLLEKLSDDCSVEINETGTKLRYRPGVLVGGRLIHDCGLSRAIGYFLEPLVVLGLFGKKPLTIRLKGITNDLKDPSVDTFRMTTLHILKHFGVPLEGLELTVVTRGAPPLGGGEVVLSIPTVHSSLSAANWVDEGMVKSVRGVTFSTKVSPQFVNRMSEAAKGVFLRLIPDVYVYTDHKSGLAGGRSPAYGISLVAETTSGCLISADSSACYPRSDEMDELEDDEKPELMPPEDLAIQVASMVLGEIEQGGVVDSTHQGLLFLLCALCPPDVSKVRVGKLSPYGIETLRNIRDFLGVKFDIKPEPVSNTVILKCVGCGLKNLSRKLS